MKKKPPRRFRVAPGATVILPRSTMTGPGATNLTFHGRAVEHRGEDGLDEFTIDGDRVDRFIRQRVRSGDLLELDPPAGGSHVVARETAGDALDIDLPAPPKRR